MKQEILQLVVSLAQALTLASFVVAVYRVIH